MKPIKQALVGLFIFGGFVALFSLLHAQETAPLTQSGEVLFEATNEVGVMSDLEVELQAIEMTTPLPASAVSPDACNFYSAQHAPDSADSWPPLPGNIWKLPVWPLGDDFYLVDDLNYNYNSLEAKSLASPGGMRAMMDFAPLDLVSSTNLWLAITNLTSNTAGLLLSNTIADVQYEIQGVANLSDTNWISEGFVFGSEITNWTPMSVVATNQPTLFLRVRSWQDDGSGLPIWWQLQYFGYVGVDPNGDPMADGWSNIQKFEYGMNPKQYYTPPVPQDTNAPPPTFTIVPGPQGNLYLIGSGLPADLSEVKVYWQETYPGFLAVAAEDYGQNQFDDINANNTGYIYIPAANITNGICQLPSTQFPPFYENSFYVQTVRSNGVSSSWADLSNQGADPIASAPFVDARRQLKDNLNFVLRATPPCYLQTFDPLTFGSSVYTSLANSWPTNYAYAGFYSSGLPSNAFDPLRPLVDNYFFRNLVYNPSYINPADGSLTTGCYYLDSPWDNGPGVDNFINGFYSSLVANNTPTYIFNVTAFITGTNWTAPASLLSSTQTRWLMPQYLFDNEDIGEPISLFLTNSFGLPYVSFENVYLANNQLHSVTLNPGQAGQYGYYYAEAAQPTLQATGYYFARPNIDPMPELPGFATTNTTPLMIVGVGQPQQIAGYAKEAILNAQSGTYGYLGQYFDKAYQITNGIVTTNTTGLLSPYGQFFATQPGLAALVTMPDIDTGARGTCTVYAVSINLDANHDGNMDLSFNGTDFTSASSPFQFWCNNNFDRGHKVDGSDNEQDDVLQGQAGIDPNDFDGNYVVGGSRQIPCVRDLEDFSRLWISGITSNLLTALPSGSTVTLNWGDVGSPYSGNPTIDLFAAADADGGIGYLTNSTIAAQQTNIFQCPYIQRLSPGGSIQLNTIQFANNWAGNHFIWCGVTNGSGQLNLTIKDGNGSVLAQASQWIQIVDIKQMYERWTVGDAPNAVSNQVPLTVAVRAADGLPTAAFQYAINPSGSRILR